MARVTRRRPRPKPGRPSLQDFEKLGAFYLGRSYDLEDESPGKDLAIYDSKDLVTHAVCVGMTGSGKTGLCICLLEEAALDGIPAIAIDPKGDLTNLLLTFPQLRPEDFRPWINEDEARREGVSPDEFAQQQADLWKGGLAAWGQDGARIERLRRAADFAIYTPGSNAGIPVSILSSFGAPPPAVRDDPELLGERVNTTTTSLLTLLGLDADPVRSREHILISAILGDIWRLGKDLDLPALIQKIQTPPIGRVGVLDLESFFPSAERFALAMRLNNLLASPTFKLWMEGVPLDVGRLLYTEQGRPRVSIFSIAHLNDVERMFFVSLLLNQVLGWMRGQPGTASLRAILYVDEVFGFFPPVANPPSKTPLLTLLKQARAYGLGVVLATQNPVDLDYKGLSNAGTWFLGRLQTERDKARVLDGLEGAAGEAGTGFDRGAIDRLLSGLGTRIFLLHNVHEDAPQVFETRWAMSYLRGPLTRDQIKRLMEPLKAGGVEAGADRDQRVLPGPKASEPPHPKAPDEEADRAGAPAARPVLPPGIPQFFAPLGSAGGGGLVRYAPVLFGVAQIQLQDSKLGVEVDREVAFITPVTAAPIAVDWTAAAETDLKPSDLRDAPAAQAEFTDLPSVATKSKSYETWAKGFAAWLARSQKVELMRSARSGQVSAPGETEREFRVRLQDAVRQRRDETAERLRQKYAPKIALLTERIRRAQQAVLREREQAQQEKVQTAVSIGATIVGAFLGRKTITPGTLGRATTAARGAGRAYRQAQDVGRAEETVQALESQLADIEAQFKSEVDAVVGTADVLAETFEATVLKPKKTQITVKMVSLVWVPRANPAPTC
jgi:hypothetical protein